MNTKLRYLLVCLIIFLYACTPNGSTPFQAKIVPEACQVKTGEQIALSLEGQIPANKEVHWEAAMGKVVWTGQGLTAMYIAPNIPGDDTITVSFISGTPTPYSASRTCAVTTETPPSPTPIPNQAPSPPDKPPAAAKPTIAISEVMGHPCGGLESKKFNQYVELYNYGSQPVDVGGGWWLYDEGEQGTPDLLTAWDARSTTRLNAALVTNSTVIPPRGFAVVISPLYPESYLEQRMPYQFPNGTVILTVSASQTLGDDFFGIIAVEDGRDTLTLYTGGVAVMNAVVDTYGTPIIKDAYPLHIEDDHLDHLPLYLHECESAERVNPLLPDEESNWTTLRNGSPGEGPY